MTDVTNLGDIVVTGNRRPSGSGAAYGGTGGGPHEEGGEHQQEIGEDPNPDPPYQYDPCDTPQKQFEKAADAGAAQTVKDLKAFAQSTHPNESDFNAREYGAMLWQLPDGSVVHGPMRAGERAFDDPDPENGRSGVELDPTIPVPGAILIGSVHTHPLGGDVLSGSTRFNDDQAVLNSHQDYRGSQFPPEHRAEAAAQAKLYVASNEPGSYQTPGPTKLNVYDERNRDAAIGGAVGPEVDPDGLPCPTP